MLPLGVEPSVIGYKPIPQKPSRTSSQLHYCSIMRTCLRNFRSTPGHLIFLGFSSSVANLFFRIANFCSLVIISNPFLLLYNRSNPAGYQQVNIVYKPAGSIPHFRQQPTVRFTTHVSRRIYVFCFQSNKKILKTKTTLLTV